MVSKDFFLSGIKLRLQVWRQNAKLWVLQKLKRFGVCERCGTKRGVKPQPSRTMYEWDGCGEDPNRDVRLCKMCAEEHHSYRDACWAEYNSGRF